MLYELTVLANPDENQDEIIEETSELLENYGEIKEFANDGKKRLAYEINGLSFAYYYMWTIGGIKDSKEAMEISKKLDNDERIIRYLLVKTKES